MPKALIVYATRTGQTQSIADLIAEGIRFTGADAEVLNAVHVKKEDELKGYDAYVLGSATYHGDMMQAMKTLLFLMAKLDVKGKAAGSFGAFGWSGEATDRIYDTMKNVFEMDMVGSPLRLKSASLQGAMQMAQDYGREIGKKMGGE
ncbi:MAG: flavodoxin domain-containing protein [Deltaproteobacteria bacterium]